MTAFTWHNYATRKWRNKRLSPRLAEILLLLHLRIGHVLSITDIIVFIWPNADEEPDYAPDIVRRYIGLIRLLYGSNTITTVHTRGYVIEK